MLTVLFGFMYDYQEVNQTHSTHSLRCGPNITPPPPPPCKRISREIIWENSIHSLYYCYKQSDGTLDYKTVHVNANFVFLSHIIEDLSEAMLWPWECLMGHMKIFRFLSIVEGWKSTVFLYSIILFFIDYGVKVKV